MHWKYVVGSELFMPDLDYFFAYKCTYICAELQKGIYTYAYATEITATDNTLSTICQTIKWFFV